MMDVADVADVAGDLTREELGSHVMRLGEGS